MKARKLVLRLLLYLYTLLLSLCSPSLFSSYTRFLQLRARGCNLRITWIGSRQFWLRKLELLGRLARGPESRHKGQ